MRTAMNNWQVTQLFLSETGVHEVELNTGSLKLRCNCTGYGNRSSCKHVRFVRERMDKNGGIYPTQISSRASKLEATVASSDPSAFRQLLIEYGKIEVV